MDEQQMKTDLAEYAAHIDKFLKIREIKESIEAVEGLLTGVTDHWDTENWELARKRCDSAQKLADDFTKSSESTKGPYYAQGRAYTYNGATHLRLDYSSLSHAIECFQAAQEAFQEALAWWSAAIAGWGLGIARCYRANLMQAVGRSHEELGEDCVGALSALQLSQEALVKANKLVEDVEGLDVGIVELKHKVDSDLEMVTEQLVCGKLVRREETPRSPPKEVTPLRILPVIDEIAAGRPKPVADKTDEYIQTDTFEINGQILEARSLGRSQVTFLSDHDYFAMQVSGDSMDQADIFPNDYVILERSRLVPTKPDPGDIVAVVFHDEDDKATLKRLSARSGQLILEPESSNAEHKPFPVSQETLSGDSSPVVGIAIAVLKHQ